MASKLEEKKKAMAYAIAEYLTIELVDANADVRESLEVAIQCLESAYGFETSDEESRAQYSIAPNTLLEIFDRGLQPPMATATLSVDDITSPETAADKKGRAEVLKSEGNEAVRQGNFQEAIGLYSEAIAVDPNNPFFYVNRAAAYTKLNMHDEAIRDCLKGISMDPTYNKAYSRLGTCYFAQHNYAGAVDAYRKALELDPGNQMYSDNLRAAEKKLNKQPGSAGSGTGTTSTYPMTEPLSNVPRAPMPDRDLGDMGESAGAGGGFPGPMPGGAGGLGGLGGLGALLNNPQLLGMAQQMMQNPAFASMYVNGPI